MSNYSQSIDFSDKDALPSGNPGKLGKGADIDTELALISAAIASKEDSANKNAANGYAGLDASGLVARSDLPSAVAYEDEANTFSGVIKITGSLELEALAAGIYFDETDAPADERIWRIVTSAGQWSLRTETDALGSGIQAIVLNRTGTAVDEIEFNATIFDLNGQAQLDAGSTIGGTSLNDTGHLTSGSMADARIPLSNVSQHAASIKTRNLPGSAGTNVTLQSDPGGTPSGSAGEVFEYY